MENNFLSNTPFLNSIICIEKFNGYSLLFMKDTEQIILQDSLDKLEGSLPSPIFYRAHRSYIINITEVVEFCYKKDSMLATLTNGKVVPIARRRRKKLLNKIFVIS